MYSSNEQFPFRDGIDGSEVAKLRVADAGTQLVLSVIKLTGSKLEMGTKFSIVYEYNYLLIFVLRLSASKTLLKVGGQALDSA